MANALALLSFILGSALVKSACQSKTELSTRHRSSECSQGRQSPMLLQVRHGVTSQLDATAECRTTVPGEKCYQEIVANDSYIFVDDDQGLPKNASLEELQNFFFAKGAAADSTFQPVDGGMARVCRGANPTDNRPSYFHVVALQSVEACEQRCLESHGCGAIEYSSGRCELWLREVEATRMMQGFQCRRMLAGSGSSWVFEAVDGAHSKVCRGSSPGDNSVEYFELSSASNVSDCLMQCFQSSLCTGVEFHETGRCELWNRPIGASQTISGYQCYRLVRKPDNRGCAVPACPSCRTAQEGEPCYEDVRWAMNDGIYYQPRWYPGLTPSSTFEEFQQLLYETGNARCNDAPCAPTTTTETTTTTTTTPPTTTTRTTTTTTASTTTTTTTTIRTTTTTTSTTIATTSMVSTTGQTGVTCQDVWEAEARDPWSVATCGARIEQFKREGLTEEEAKAKVGLFYTACEACWPWPKYKDATDNRISMKRGIAAQNWRLTSESLSTLAQNMYWGYVWHHQPMNWQGGPSLDEWERHGINFIPMVWGEGRDRLDQALEEGLPRGKRALLGFNEPNFPEQANLLPARAASLWPLVEELARNASIDYIVSPALNFAAYDPIQWLQEFFGNCTGCKVDAVGFHSYTCYGRYLKDHIELYKIFKRPLWLTEFACCEASSLERLSAEGQMAYMREAIPLLERDESIEMYSWFSMFEDDWEFPIVEGKNGDAGLVYGNGTLSPLGELYASFTGPRLVAPPPIAPPTTTPPPCRTSQAGEGCYDAVLWAMTSGIVTNPEWYGDLTVESSFEDFQDFFFQERTLNGVCEAPACPACRTAVRGEKCYEDVKWAMHTGIPDHPEWYKGLTAESSFEEVQEFLWREDINENCQQPCAPLCSSSGNCSAMGVNVFGFDGFSDEDSVKVAVKKLFQKGIRNFRVVNVGAWADAALTAINEAAGVYAGPSSVKITNLFFDSASTCSSLPSWMDFSISTTLAKLRRLTNVPRIFLQLDTCSICQDAELYCINPTEQGFGQSEPKAETFRKFIQEQYGPMIQEAHKAFPADVEFVIPFQNERASPRAMLEELIAKYIQPLRSQGRKFYIEGTLYPFWVSTLQAFAPFDTSGVISSLSFASEVGLDGFLLAETGWPQACPLNENRRPATLQNMCRYWDNTLREVEKLAQAAGTSLLVYHWKMGPANDGSCGESTWGLFTKNGTFVCDP